MFETIPSIIALAGLVLTGAYLLLVLYLKMVGWDDQIPDQMPHLVNRPPVDWKRQLQCQIGFHEWTSRIEMGARPIGPPVRDVAGSFFAFAAPVCKHCPTQLTPL